MLNNQVGTKTNPLDFLGFLLFGVGLAGFTFAFEFIRENTLSNELVVSNIFSFFVVFSAYFIRSYYVAVPILDFSVFKIRTFRITVLGSFLSRCSIGGIPFLLPLFFQLSLGKSPLYSGLLLLPYAIAILIIKFLVKRSLKKFRFKNLLIVNTFLLEGSILAFMLVDPYVYLYFLLPLIFIHRLLTSMQFSCMNVLSYVDLNEKNMSKGTSIASAIQQLSIFLRKQMAQKQVYTKSNNFL